MAVDRGDAYDEQFVALTTAATTPNDAYRDLVIDDVRDAPGSVDLPLTAAGYRRVRVDRSRARTRTRYSRHACKEQDGHWVHITIAG